MKISDIEFRCEPDSLMIELPIDVHPLLDSDMFILQSLLRSMCETRDVKKIEVYYNMDKDEN